MSAAEAATLDRERLREEIRELVRELSQRKTHYPRWIREGRLPERLAAERIDLLERAIVRLRGLDQPELAL
jgi:hypothetical protein